MSDLSTEDQEDKNVIGDRIRQARLAAGLTQEEVVQRLESAGLKITKAALSKYEKGKSEPKQSVLVLLGRVLGAKPSYFLTEPVLRFEWLAFRKQTKLRKSKQEQIKAFVEDVVEKQSRLEDVFYPRQHRPFQSQLSLPRHRMLRQFRNNCERNGSSMTHR